MERGSVRYPGVRAIHAIPANNFTNNLDFNASNVDQITLDTGLLEVSTFDDDNGISMEEYTITGKIAGLSSNKSILNKKFVLLVEFYYDTTKMYIGTKQYPAILSIKASTGQTGGNFIGSEINYHCLFPSVRKPA